MTPAIKSTFGLLGVIAALWMTAQSPALARGDPALGAEIAARVCVACHGPTGISPLPNTPRLAGMHSAYLIKQMRDYRDGKRDHEVMVNILVGLTNEDFDHVAAYFAEQTPILGVVTDESLLALGETVYRDGNPGSGVPSCSGCHGDLGEGTRRFPLVAGQSVDYTLEQMRRFATRERTNDRGLMQTVAERLTENETRAVAQYIASLSLSDIADEE